MAFNLIELIRDSADTRTQIKNNFPSSKRSLNEVLKISFSNDKELFEKNNDTPSIKFKFRGKSQFSNISKNFRNSDKKEIKNLSNKNLDQSRPTQSAGKLNRITKKIDREKNLFIQEDLNADNASLPEIFSNKENSFENFEPYSKHISENKFPDNLTENKINSNLNYQDENLNHNITNKKLSSTGIEKIKNKKNLFSSDNILDTIQLISHNPNKFKQTNQILRSLGQLTANNYNIVTKDQNRDEKVTKALKDFESAEKNRESVLLQVKQREEMLKRNEIETKENKSK